MPLIQLLKIPEPAPAHSALGAQIKRASVKGTDGQGLVFVIDDDDLFRKSLENLIRSARLKVKAFASAEEFLTSDRFRSANCLILDVRMPGMSGIELQRQLVADHSEVPVIFITAHEDPAMRAEALRDGAEAVLIKPFSEEALLDAIHAALITQ